MRTHLPLLFVAILIPATAVSQDCIEYDDYFHWVRNVIDTGEVRDIAVHRVGFIEYMYAACDEGLKVIDVSSPGFPTVVDVVPVIGDARGLDIDGGFLYVAAYDGGLRIYDLTDPASPTLAGSEVLACWPNAVDIQYPIAYVTGTDPEFQLVNIINPANPIELGSLAFSGVGHDIEVDGYYAYIAESYYGLRVIEIAGVDDLIEVGHLSTPDGARGVAMYGDYLYLAADHGLCVVDVHIPGNPQLHGYVGDFPYLKDVLVTSDRAFTASESGGVQSFDISDPANPQLAGHVALIGGAACLARPFGYVYLYAGGIGDIQVIDKSNPDGPSLIGAIDTPGNCPDVVASGDFAYVADGSSGFQVIDLTTPSAPTIAGSAPTSGYAVGVDVQGSHAYVAVSGAGLDVFDVSDPADPTRVGELDFTGVVGTGVDAVGSRVYIADGAYGLRVIDVSNPATPFQVGSLQVTAGIESVAVVGDYAYGASSNFGLRVIDVANPTSPQLVGSLPFFGNIERLDANDNSHVYLACQYDGFWIAEVTDPTHPQIVAEIATPGFTHDVHAAGPFVYVADRTSGVLVYDKSSPAFPDLMGAIASSWAAALYADGSHLFISDNFDGLLIGPAQCGAVSAIVDTPPVRTVELVAHPNPFNPSTRISFSLRVAGRAAIGIYDLSGHRVSLLADRTFAAGNHSLTWDGRDTAGRAMPSGPYFVRLEKESGPETRKVMLVR